MKKLLILFLCTSLLWACNDDNKSTEIKNASEHADHKADSSHQQKTGEHALALNNGKKWDGDESTNQNVEALKSIITPFGQKENRTMEDYSVLAADLQAGLDKMVKECRMKGADHDALHLWLEPLMKDVADLKNSKTENEAASLFTKINEQVNIYNSYFE